jgi:glycosyltransferase involved in cell wall biosynthesis
MISLSIVIPCYNSEKFIGKTIESILNQSFQDWELLIINDGSTDDSLDIITKYQLIDHRIQVFSIKNGGVNKARNFGYTKVNADSKYIHFMDSDDILDQKYYNQLVSFLELNPDFGAAYSNHYFIDENDNKTLSSNWGDRQIPTRLWMRKIEDDFIETPFISIALWCKMVEPMVIIRKSIFEKSKKWDESFSYGKIGEGVVLFSEISLKSKVAYLNQELFFYRRHPIQSSQNNVLSFNAFKYTTFKINSLLETPLQRISFRTGVNRYYAFSEFNKLKHYARYNKIQFVLSFSRFFMSYLKSIPLVFINTRFLND